jgi:Ca2+-binding RTX toxin-like protein
VELFGDGAESVVEFVNLVAAIVTAIEEIDALVSAGDNIKIIFGDYHITGNPHDPREDTEIIPEEGGLSGADDYDQTIAENQAQGGIFERLANLLDTLESYPIGISFPLLRNPLEAFKLLFGQDVVLFEWDLLGEERLDITFEWEVSMGPLIPPIPLYANIFARFTLFCDISLGFDTSGLRNGGRFWEGFYFGDEKPVIGMEVEFGAGAELNLVLIWAGVEGGVRATIGAGWNDLNNDGRFHIPELITRFEQGIECIFELTGQLSAFLRAYGGIGIKIFGVKIVIFEKSFTLLDVVIFDFCIACPPIPPPVLAHKEGSTLVLNIGPDADQRQPGYSEDGDEMIEVEQEGDTIIVSGFGEIQEYDGVTEIYADGGEGADEITIHESVNMPVELLGGAGDDYLIGGNGVNTLRGGDGNDRLTGGPEGDFLYGDDGDDTLYAGDGNDELYGGAGNDMLRGENDDDTIEGGDGDDDLDGGKGTDDLSGDGGDDQLVGGDGVNTLDGGDGNDVINGGDEYDNIDGGAGDDNIFAGDDDDDIHGGDGDDLIYAEEGDDHIWGDGGSDSLLGGEDDDTYYFDDATSDESDVLEESEDSSGGIDLLDFSNMNDDVTINLNLGIGSSTHRTMELANPDYFEHVTGGNGDDSISDNLNENILIGGPGHDTYYFGAATDWPYQYDIVEEQNSGGVDTLDFSDLPSNDDLTADIGFPRDPDSGFSRPVIAVHNTRTLNTSSDLLDQYFENITGGDGDDLIIGNTADNGLIGNPGVDVIEGRTGDDYIHGSEGDDLLYGEEDEDTIHGGDGEDTIWGNSEDDTIYGDDGNDIIEGNDDNDYIEGNAGDDFIYGNQGDDEIYGNRGMDTIWGDDAIISGPDGNDIIYGNAGEDRLFGEGGDDEMHGGPNRDFMLGDDGDDILYGDSGDDLVSGGIDTGNGHPMFAGEYNPDGSSAANTFGDKVYGGDGHDLVLGELPSAHTFSDPTGTVLLNTLEQIVADKFRDMIYDLVATRYGGVTPGEEDEDYKKFFIAFLNENSTQGDDHDDLLHGDPGNDLLIGLDGADYLFGDWGDDVLIPYKIGNVSALTEDRVEGGPDSERLMCGTDGVNLMIGGTSDINLNYTLYNPGPPVKSPLSGGYDLPSCVMDEKPLLFVTDPVAIIGQKFKDADHDGVKDWNETGINGWTIELYDYEGELVESTTTGEVDLNLDGYIDPYTEAGVYSFKNVSENGTIPGFGPGTYYVREVAQDGYARTVPSMADNYTHELSLDSGEVAEGVNFGNIELGQIHGIVWEDIDGDGVFDEGEPPLEGWEVRLQYLIWTITTQTTDENGKYSFTGLGGPFTWVLALTTPSSWSLTYPGFGFHAVTVTYDQVVEDVNFGVVELAQINGTKWNDLNGNGVQDEGEPGIDNWEIKLYDMDGTEVASNVTYSGGQYWLQDIEPGIYRVVEEDKTDWEQTYPGEDNSWEYMVLIESGDVLEDLDFGNYENATISGTKWQDTDVDGELGGGELGIGGWTIYLDLNNNSKLDDDEPTTETSALDGSYEFTGLAPGDYIVAEVVIDDWVQTYPVLKKGYSVNYVNVESGEDETDINFGNIEMGEIYGVKWEDINGNGIREIDEPGLPNWLVYLDLNNNGLLDDDEPAKKTSYDNPDTTADESGQYNFTELVPVTYTVAEELQEGWLQSTPLTPYPVEFTFGGPVTEFMGNVTNLSEPWNCGINIGDTWSLTIYFDPNTEDTHTNTSTGEYHAVTRYSLSVGCGLDEATIESQTTTIEIWNAAPGGTDLYAVYFPVEGGLMFMWMEDPTGTAITSEDLPLGGQLDISDFSSFNFVFLFSFSKSINGTIDLHEWSGQGAHSIDLSPGDSVEANFGNARTSEIHGRKWEDMDGDGFKDISDSDLPVPSVEFAYPEAGANMTSEDVEITFITEDFTVGGYGETHLAFRLNSSNDTFMFYNGTNNVVGLNEDFGPTPNATWVSPKTIMLNDLNEGEHLIEVWLVDADNNSYTNSQAYDSLYFNVNTSIVSPPAVTIIHPFNRSTVTTSDVQLTFATTNFPVGGIGDQHLMFIVDNGADELMFYNHPDNTVELNSNPTGLATWISNNTIQFNGLSDGNHTITAYLVNEFDNPLGNPEAEYSMNLTVNTTVSPEAVDEEGVAGVTIYLDLNNNGFLDPDEPYTTTMEDDPSTTGYDEAGLYSFTDLLPGKYIVREILPTGMVQTYPNSPHPVEFTFSGPVTGVFDLFNVLEAPWDGVVSGDIWSLTIAFEPWTTDENSSSSVGMYPAITGYTLTIGEGSISELVDPEDTFIRVIDGDPPGTDRYQVYVPIAGGKYLLGMDLIDNTDTALTSDALPLCGEINPADYGETHLYFVDSELLIFGMIHGTLASHDSLCVSEYAHLLEISSGEIVEDADFGNVFPGVIKGRKWNDLNANGEWDTGEPGFPGWTIYLDLNNNGQWDSDEPFDVTDAYGRYRFKELIPGTYTVAEINQPGFAQTYPGAGNIYRHFVRLESGEVAKNRSFGNVRGSGVTGTKWLDLNRNGRRDPDEPGLPGIVIYLDKNGNGRRDRNEVYTVTQFDDPSTPEDESGRYEFTGLLPGNYTVREDLPEGFVQTYPSGGGGSACQFVEDFEAGPANWTTDTSLPLNLWHMTNDYRGNDTNQNGDLIGNHWYFGSDTTHNYDFGLVFGILRSPVYTINGYKPRLEFDTFARTDGRPNADIKSVQVSVNGGPFIMIDTVGTPAGHPDSPPSVWDHVAFPFSAKLGDTVQFQFVFVSVDEWDNDHEGWRIDNICLSVYDREQPDNDGHDITVNLRQNVTGVDFGNYGDPGNITGYKWLDLDGDGVRDVKRVVTVGGYTTVEWGEPGIAGVTIYLDLNRNGQLDPGEPTTETMMDDPSTCEDETGFYRFENLVPGIYIVAEDIDPPWVQTYPGSGPGTGQTSFQLIQASAQSSSPSRPPGTHMVPVYPGRTQGNVNFGNIIYGEIHGTKWNDLNGNRIHDKGEPGLPGWTIYIDLNNNGKFDPGEPYSITMEDNPDTPEDETGRYVIRGLVPGVYIVREVEKPGWEHTCPCQGRHVIVLDLGQIVREVDFCNKASPGSIRGQKFEDVNGDGKRGRNEPSLNNWTIYLYRITPSPVSGQTSSTPTAKLETSGQKSPGYTIELVDTQLTHDWDWNGDGIIDPVNETGWYWFTNLEPGIYVVAEELQDGWIQTYPDPKGDATRKTGNDTSRIIGGDDIYRDTTEEYPGDTTRETGEETTGETTRKTGQSSSKRIDSADLRDGGIYTINGVYIVRLETGQNLSRLDFGNHEPKGDIRGQKFNDLNGNSRRDKEEPGLNNWTILLYEITKDPTTRKNVKTLIDSQNTTDMDLNYDGEIDPVRESGWYWFRDLKPGYYIVEEVLQDGWVQTFPYYIAQNTSQRKTQSESTIIVGEDIVRDDDVDRTDKVIVTTKGKYRIKLESGQTAKGIDFGNNESIGRAPVAIMKGASYLNEGDSLVLDGSSSFDYDGVIVEYIWDFGDGTTYNETAGSTPDGLFDGITIHKYKDDDPTGTPSDDYIVILKVVDDDGLVGSVTIMVTVRNVAPKVHIYSVETSPDDPLPEVYLPGEPITFHGEFSDPGTPDTFTIIWDFGDGTADISGKLDIVHIYTAPGTYTVELTVIDDDLGKGTDTFVITIGTVEVVLQTTIEYVQELNTTDFDSADQQASYIDKLQEVLRMVSEGNTKAAIQKLLHDLLPKTDGRSSTQDWIIEPTVQETVEIILLTVVYELENDTQPQPGGGSGIHGIKWNDLDADGERDDDEPGLPDWTITLLDTAGNLLATATTGSEGHYSFPDLMPGTYVVGEVLKPGWQQTFPPNGYHVIDLQMGQTITGAHFGNYEISTGEPGTIQGRKWFDADMDGHWDADEYGLANWLIRLFRITYDENGNPQAELVDSQLTQDIDLNGDGAIDPITETGVYQFDDVKPGQYVVAEVLLPGWIQTFPTTNFGMHVVFVEEGKQLTNFNFGNIGLGGIYGQKWWDINGDGERDDNEPGLSGWTIDLYLAVKVGFGVVYTLANTTVTADVDLNGDGVIDPMTEAGWYWFINLPPSDIIPSGSFYLVDERLKEGWKQTYPDPSGGPPFQPGSGGLNSTSSGIDWPPEIHVITLEFGETVINADFGNFGEGEITGQKFHDQNGNERHEKNEPGLNGWTIELYRVEYVGAPGLLATAAAQGGGWNVTLIATQITHDIDLNGDGIIDPNTESGLYHFTGLGPGKYIVREIQQDGWIQTYPPVKKVQLPLGYSKNRIYFLELGPGKGSNNKGGYKAKEIDFGNREYHGGLEGQKFEDTNGNGIRDPDEPGLSGWTIELYRVKGTQGLSKAQGGGRITNLLNVTLVLVDTTVTIDVDINNDGWIDPVKEAGWYGFYNLKPGVYIVKEVLQNNWTQTYPGEELVRGKGKEKNTATFNGTHIVRIIDENVIKERDFGNFRLAEINGTKFNDTDCCHDYDPGEPGMAGVIIYIDLNDNNEFDPGEPNRTTMANDETTTEDETGWYRFTGLEIGTYIIREVIPEGYFQSYPESIEYEIEITSSGQIVPQVDFGNYDPVDLVDGSDEIYGADEDDLIYGDNIVTDPCIFTIGDDDYIWGERGNDTLIGQLENDTYFFEPAVESGEEIDIVIEYINEVKENPEGIRVTNGSADRLDFSALPLEEPVTVDLSGTDPAWLANAQIAIHTSPNGTGTHLVVTNETHQHDYIEAVLGGDGFDIIKGNIADNWLNGGPGNDTLEGLDGNDTYVFWYANSYDSDEVIEAAGPKSGNDTLDFSDITVPVIVDLSALPNPPIYSPTIAMYDTLNVTSSAPVNLEIVIGGTNHDTITGNTANNIFIGGTGDDIYYFKDGWGDDLVVELFDEGDDTMDFSQVTVFLTFTIGSITVTDGTNVATHLESNVEHIIGGTGGNKLEGPDSLNTWIITDINEGTLNGIHFYGMENLAGGSDIDLFIFTPTGEITGIVSGGAGWNLLQAAHIENTWYITGTNAGNIPGVVDFIDIQVLHGGNENDTFIFSDGASVDGGVYGKFGYDILDYSAYTTPITVDLENLIATGTGGFQSIEKVIGGTDMDNIIGPNSITTWDIIGSDEVNVMGMEFVDIENLQGGTDDDTFEFADGAGVSGTIDGDGNYDIMDYSAYTTNVTVDLDTMSATGCGKFTNIEKIIGGSAGDEIIGPNTGTAMNITGSNDIEVLGIDFESFVYLYGGASDDNFVFSDGATISGIIDGGAGLDTLDYSAYATDITVDLGNNTATGTAGAYDIEKVIGGSGDDTLIGPNMVSTWNIQGANEGEIPAIVEFIDIENLIGGTLQDSFEFDDGAYVTGTIDGGDGSNVLDYSAYTTAVTVNLELNQATGCSEFANIDKLFGGTASDLLIGPNATMTWYIAGSDSGNVHGMGFDGFENLNGGSENDTFVFSVIGTMISGHIDGQGGINTLDYYNYPTNVTVNLNLGSANGTGSVSNIQNVIGSQNGFNILIGSSDDNILVGGNEADYISGLDGNDILLGGDGNDTLVGFLGFDILVGGAGNDTLLGMGGDDILIGSTTSYDDITVANNMIAWEAFREEWTSGDSYNNRTVKIRDIGVGPYNDTLTANVTVFDDADGDDLYGNTEDDWFFAAAGEAQDVEIGEIVENL